MKDAQGRECVGDWMKVYDPSTKLYYYWNIKSHESVWEEPYIFKQARALQQQQQQQQTHLSQHQPTLANSSTRHKRGLPKGWSRHLDPKSGYPYYWNEYTEEPSWIRPQEDVKLPIGWTEEFDARRNRRFFWHSATQKATWRYPH